MGENDKFTELLANIFKNINEFTRYAEAKNSILVGFNSVAIFGFLKIYNDFNSEVVRIYLFSAILFLSLSTLIALISFLPKLRDVRRSEKSSCPSQDDNLIFFKHIEKYTEDEYLQALSGVMKIEESALKELDRYYANQIIINSKITARKFRYFELSIWLAVCGVFTVVLAGLYYLFEKY